MCRFKPDVSTQPSPQSSGNHMKEEAEGVGKTEGLEDSRKTRSSKTAERSLCELTETEAASTGSPGSAPRPLHMYLSFQFGAFIELLNV